MEHLQHFGLSKDPFQNEPDLRFYFDSASHRDAQLRIERGLRQHKGLTVLTGDSGSGKTLVTRRIFDRLEEEVYEVSLMVMLPGAADAASVLARYARQLGVDTPSADRGVLLGQLYEKLAIVREDGRHSLLIVDDAHVLESDAMAEIAGLSNLEYEDRRLLSMLWVGSPSLDVALSHLPGVGQRVEVRAVLSPLDLENSTAYVRHRLTTAAGSPEIVPESAMSALYKYGRGRPRLLNTLADNALFEAYLAGRDQMAVGDVERAGAELGIGLEPGTTYSQLPQPQGPVPDPIPTPGGGDSGASPGAGVSPEDSLDLGMVGAQSQVDIGSLFDGAEGGVAPELDLEPPDLDAVSVADADDLLAEPTRIAFEDEEAALDAAGVAAPAMGEAEATRIAFADEVADVEPEPLPAQAVEGTGGSDEIDDLFVELIDE